VYWCRKGSFSELLRRRRSPELSELADTGGKAKNTHSAVFAEVKIDQELQIVRVTRVVIAVAGAAPNTIKYLDKAQTQD
jgi:CO/xanthine dehydrogenase Mo-binding subunit